MRGPSSSALQTSTRMTSSGSLAMLRINLANPRFWQVGLLVGWETSSGGVGVVGWSDEGERDGGAELFGQLEPFRACFHAGDEYQAVDVLAVDLEGVDFAVDFVEAFVELGDCPLGEDGVEKVVVGFDAVDQTVDDVGKQGFAEWYSFGEIEGGGGGWGDLELCAQGKDGTVFLEVVVQDLWCLGGKGDVLCDELCAQAVDFVEALHGVEGVEFEQELVGELGDEFGGLECVVKEFLRACIDVGSKIASDA